MELQDQKDLAISNAAILTIAAILAIADTLAIADNLAFSEQQNTKALLSNNFS
jgi:hypothetical protein